MFNVIDTIDYRNSWIYRYSEWQKRGEGVLVILDPEQIDQPPEVQNLTVTIYKPDGSISHFVANSSERLHSMVGIFFRDVFSDEIPRGSKIEW